MTALYKNVPVLDAGARGSTNTFVQRGIGDVLLAWENEAYLAVAESKGQFDIVAPPTSILAEPPVAVVDHIASKRGTTAVAQAYLEYLGSPEGQEIAAKNHYRPRDPNVLKKYRATFADVKLFTINDAFGGWQAANKTHFASGATFDQIYQPGRKVAAGTPIDDPRQTPLGLPGFRITMAFTLLYLVAIVLVPLLTLPFKSFSEGCASSGTRSAIRGSSRPIA